MCLEVRSVGISNSEFLYDYVYEERIHSTSQIITKRFVLVFKVKVAITKLLFHALPSTEMKSKMLRRIPANLPNHPPTYLESINQSIY